MNQLPGLVCLIASGSGNLSIWAVVSSESPTVRTEFFFQAHLCNYFPVTAPCHMSLHRLPSNMQLGFGQVSETGVRLSL